VSWFREKIGMGAVHYLVSEVGPKRIRGRRFATTARLGITGSAPSRPRRARGADTRVDQYRAIPRTTCPRFLFTTSHESGVSLPALTARRPHPDTALSPSSRPTQDKENVSSPMATLNASMGEVNRDYHRRVRPWPTATCHRPVDTTDALVFSGEPFTQRQQRRVLMSTPRPRGSREGPAPTTSGTTVLTLFPRIPTHPPPPPDSRRGGGVHGVGHIPTSRGHGCESGGVVCVG
jgi:hypothetical protein